MAAENRYFIDIHSHILPGVDDGPASMTDSRLLALEASKNKITDIVATPHTTLNSSFSKTFLNQKVKELNKELKASNINVKIHKGAEYYCSLDLLSQTKTKRLILLPSKKHILLHIPFSVLPVFLERLVFQLNLVQIKPILAHIELNQQLQRNLMLAKKLHQMGALLQVTAASFTGKLGKLAKKTAFTLLKERLVFAVASDAHSVFFKPPNFLSVFEMVKSLTDVEYAYKLLADNPRLCLAKE